MAAAETQSRLMLIDGALVKGDAGLRPVINPADGKPFAEVPEASAEQARQAIAAARKAQIRQVLSPRSMDRSFKGMLWRRRSFQLMPPQLPSVSESPETRPSYLRNPDVGEPPPPQC